MCRPHPVAFCVATHTGDRSSTGRAIVRGLTLYVSLGNRCVCIVIRCFVDKFVFGRRKDLVPPKRLPEIFLLSGMENNANFAVPGGLPNPNPCINIITAPSHKTLDCCRVVLFSCFLTIFYPLSILVKKKNWQEKTKWTPMILYHLWIFRWMTILCRLRR